jgi:pimeloyl-ACP methyl ester carboxylesterase
MAWSAGLKGVEVDYAIDCYKVVYPSRDERGRFVSLSGLLALPHDKTAHVLVSFQHGTTSKRDDVPSNLSAGGLEAAILLAGNGYATIAPDYVGLGVSTRPQTYFVAADTARAIADMIDAVRHVRGVPSGPPFFVGFSEGGFASFTAQRFLESQGQRVMGTASIAGAFNLRTVSIPWTLKGLSPEASTYLALWVRSYATRYGHPLGTAFLPRYAALLPKLFDEPQAPKEVENSLPRDPRRMFTAEALEALDGKGHHWLVDALGANEMGDWKAEAPIRLYYGSQDVDVPPIEATLTARQMSARGSSVTAISVGSADHEGSVLLAAPLILAWLKSGVRP